MGFHGEYRSLVDRRLLYVFFAFWLSTETAIAQSRIETPGENVRRRQAEQKSRSAPYWDGFILKHQGNCREAIGKLAPLARLGVGYEDAQTALGECYLQLAGLDTKGVDAPARDAIADNGDYQAGLEWISTAAQSGSFEAQGVMVSLYAAGLGPTDNDIDGALWAHLYLTNPTRLNLGAPLLAQRSIENLKSSMSEDEWLLAKQKARIWVPHYAPARDKK